MFCGFHCLLPFLLPFFVPRLCNLCTFVMPSVSSLIHCINRLGVCLHTHLQESTLSPAHPFVWVVCPFSCLFIHSSIHLSISLFIHLFIQSAVWSCPKARRTSCYKENSRLLLVAPANSVPNLSSITLSKVFPCTTVPMVEASGVYCNCRCLMLAQAHLGAFVFHQLSILPFSLHYFPGVHPCPRFSLGWA